MIFFMPLGVFLQEFKARVSGEFKGTIRKTVGNFREGAKRFKGFQGISGASGKFKKSYR